LNQKNEVSNAGYGYFGVLLLFLNDPADRKAI